MTLLTAGRTSAFFTAEAAIGAALLGDTIALETGPGMEIVGDGDTTIVFSDGDNLIITGAGTDTITVGSGNDTIFAGEGANTITGLAGDKIIVVGAAADTITVSSGNNIVFAGAGANTITGTSGNNRIWAEEGADTITVTSGNNIIFAGAGASTVTGTTGDNQIWAEGGADTITLTTGNNVIHAEAGANTITATSGTNIITAGAGADTVTVTSGNNRICVGDGANTVTATSGDNIITTGSGADTIVVTSGSNIIRAGNGANTIAATSGYNIIIGGSGADTIATTDGGNFIDAGDGANTVATGAGNDVIITGVDTDTVAAGAGDDTITVRGGTDAIAGGAGFDTLIVDFSNAIGDVITSPLAGTFAAGYAGDVTTAGTGAATFARIEAFDITTGTGNDWITTGEGDDTINSGEGNDQIDAGAGSDFIAGSAGDKIDGGEGGSDFDTLNLYGFGANEVVYDALNGENGTVYALDADGHKTGQSLFFTNIELVTDIPFALATLPPAYVTLLENQCSVLDISSMTIMDADCCDDLTVVPTASVNIMRVAILDEEMAINSGTVDFDTAKAEPLVIEKSVDVEMITLAVTDSIIAAGNVLDNVLIGNSAENILPALAGGNTVISGADVDHFVFTSPNGTDTFTDYNAPAGGAAQGDVLELHNMLHGAFDYMGANDFSGGALYAEIRAGGSQVDIDLTGDGVAEILLDIAGLTNAGQIYANDFLWI